MWAVVGLGNPKRRYFQTRHNVGRMVIDELLRRTSRRFPPAIIAGKPYQALRLDLGGGEFLVARLRSYMNISGPAVAHLISHNPVGIEELLVVVDDINLPLGTLRLRPFGSDGGHKGLRSIIEVLQREDFPRLRLGIDPPPAGVDASDYVLSPFDSGEREGAVQMIALAGDCVEMVVEQGVETAMQRFNKRK